MMLVDQVYFPAAAAGGAGAPGAAGTAVGNFTSGVTGTAGTTGGTAGTAGTTGGTTPAWGNACAVMTTIMITRTVGDMVVLVGGGMSV